MKNLLFGHFLGNFRDIGLLLMRIGLGLSFVLVMGRNKIFGGSEMWQGVGGRALGLIGMGDAGFLATLLGLIASVTEFFGGLLLLVGLLTRPAAALLAFTMLVAFLTHVQIDGFDAILSNPQAGIFAFMLILVFSAITILGAGRFSLDYMITKKA